MPVTIKSDSGSSRSPSCRSPSRFARENGIARYVTVTTTAIERMFKRQNVNIHRLGPPMRIGQVMTVAFFIENDDVTAKALGM